MFVQSIHQIGRVLNVAQILSEMSVVTDQNSDPIGLYHTEFTLPKSKQSPSKAVQNLHSRFPQNHTAHLR